MTYNVYLKGSQWRKWDLHVHTAASFHWNGGALLRDMNEQEKEATFQQLLATLERTDVAVFCFTDYWTFDGYIQFINYLKHNNLSCSKTIFPGMELRVEAPVDYRLNIQVILSDSLTEQQLEDFKSKLTIRSINRRISDESIMEFAGTLDVSKAEKHGFDDPSHLSDNDLLRLGAITIEVTKSSLEKAVQSVPPATAYIVLPFDTSDGLEKLDWETQPQADNYFMQTAHAFESRKEETTNLFLGIETDKNRHFIENFQKTLNYMQKPVICGSDAHRLSDYGKYPSNRITWIKADPTFQGFRQIFFEPRERVRIQDLPPEEKTPYLVIDKVRFIDNTGKFFPTGWIELNENLNTVIGGKSSGKSLLLYHIVKTVAPDLMDKRTQEIAIPVYRFGDPGQLDFEVRWKDGHTDTLSSASEHTSREIEYIPQMYVNSLAEREGRRSLYQLIESILEQNATYRDFVHQIRNEISQLETDIERDLSNLLRLRSEIQRLLSERKEIGTLSAIKGEIQRLSSKIDVLREESGFTSQEKRRYESLQRSMHIQLERRRKYDSLHRAIMDLVAAINRLQNHVAGTLDASPAEYGLDRFSKRIITQLSSSATSRITNTFSAIAKSQSSVADRARAKAAKCGNHAQRIKEFLKPYEHKVRDQQLLEKLSSDLERQQKILADYRDKQSRIDTVREAGLRTRESLFKNYSDLLERHKRIVSMLQLDEYSKIDEEITLETSLKFDTEGFFKSFSDLFDRRCNFKPIFGSCFDEHNDFCFEEDSHIETIISIYETLLSTPRDPIRFKQDATINDAISQLFKNYFLIEYNIRYKDDDILDMSPGKRGLVLLQLILHISNATHPILIDQPEDNLDNRTISTELRKFVKAKKLARQIVMVTHDANLVVLTDAENVIVSNQAGQLADRENAEFRFEYVTGALEHSFRQPENQAPGVLFSCGIREHVCDILEGGEEAFRKREQRYGFSNP
jgi:hypothetical protein